MQTQKLAYQLTALILSAALTLPPSAYALRPQEKQEASGLEELTKALRLGNPDAALDTLVQSVAERLTLPVPATGQEEGPADRIRTLLERSPNTETIFHIIGRDLLSTYPDLRGFHDLHSSFAVEGISNSSSDLIRRHAGPGHLEVWYHYPQKAVWISWEEMQYSATNSRRGFQRKVYLSTPARERLGVEGFLRHLLGPGQLNVPSELWDGDEAMFQVLEDLATLSSAGQEEAEQIHQFPKDVISEEELHLLPAQIFLWGMFRFNQVVEDRFVVRLKNRRNKIEIIPGDPEDLPEDAAMMRLEVQAQDTVTVTVEGAASPEIREMAADIVSDWLSKVFQVNQELKAKQAEHEGSFKDKANAIKRRAWDEFSESLTPLKAALSAGQEEAALDEIEAAIETKRSLDFTPTTILKHGDVLGRFHGARGASADVYVEADHVLGKVLNSPFFLRMVLAQHLGKTIAGATPLSVDRHRPPPDNVRFALNLPYRDYLEAMEPSLEMLERLIDDPGEMVEVVVVEPAPHSGGAWVIYKGGPGEAWVPGFIPTRFVFAKSVPHSAAPGRWWLHSKIGQTIRVRPDSVNRRGHFPQAVFAADQSFNAVRREIRLAERELQQRDKEHIPVRVILVHEALQGVEVMYRSQNGGWISGFIPPSRISFHSKGRPVGRLPHLLDRLGWFLSRVGQDIPADLIAIDSSRGLPRATFSVRLSLEEVLQEMQPALERLGQAAANPNDRVDVELALLGSREDANSMRYSHWNQTSWVPGFIPASLFLDDPHQKVHTSIIRAWLWRHRHEKIPVAVKDVTHNRHLPRAAFSLGLTIDQLKAEIEPAAEQLEGLGPGELQVPCEVIPATVEAGAEVLYRGPRGTWIPGFIHKSYIRFLDRTVAPHALWSQWLKRQVGRKINVTFNHIKRNDPIPSALFSLTLPEDVRPSFRPGKTASAGQEEWSADVWNRLHAVGLHGTTGPLLKEIIQYYSRQGADADFEGVREKWEAIARIIPDAPSLSGVAEGVVSGFIERELPLWKLSGVLLRRGRYGEGHGVLLIGDARHATVKAPQTIQINRGLTGLALFLVGDPNMSWVKPPPKAPDWRFLAQNNLVGFVSDGQLIVGSNPTTENPSGLRAKIGWRDDDVPFGSTRIQSRGEFIPVERIIKLEMKDTKPSKIEAVWVGSSHVAIPEALVQILERIDAIHLEIQEGDRLGQYREYAGRLHREYFAGLEEVQDEVVRQAWDELRRIVTLEEFQVDDEEALVRFGKSTGAKVVKKTITGRPIVTIGPEMFRKLTAFRQTGQLPPGTPAKHYEELRNNDEVNEPGVYVSPTGLKMAHQELAAAGIDFRYTKGIFFHEALEEGFDGSGITDPILALCEQHTDPRVIEEELLVNALIGEESVEASRAGYQFAKQRVDQNLSNSQRFFAFVKDRYESGGRSTTFDEIEASLGPTSRYYRTLQWVVDTPYDQLLALAQRRWEGSDYSSAVPLAAGLEEETTRVLAPTLEVPIAALEEGNLEQALQGSAYLLEPKPTTDQLETSFVQFPGELWAVGFRDRDNIPHLAVGAGNRDHAIGITDFLTKAYSAAPVSVDVVHKHPEPPFPSKGDFDLLRTWKLRQGGRVGRQRNWVEIRRDGVWRLLGYGRDYKETADFQREIQVQIWKRGERAQNEFYLPGTGGLRVALVADQEVFGIPGLDYFYQLIDQPETTGVRFEDAVGHWVLWRADNTWESIFESQGYTRSATSFSTASRAGPVEAAGALLTRLAQAAEGQPGVLVLTPEAIQDPAGLEELIKRLPPELLRRTIWFNTGVALAEYLHSLEPTLQIIKDYNTQALVLKLLSREEAEKITTTSKDLALYLQEVLPMTVTYLKVLTVKLILAALGVPIEQLNQIDPTKLEALFAPLVAA